MQSGKPLSSFKTCVCLTLGCLVLGQAHTQADESTVIPVMVEALARLDATDIDTDWYFTMEVEEEGEILVIQSDPKRDKYDQRQLLTVDGIAPDPSRQKAFRESEVERIDDIDPEASGYQYMVDAQTLRLLEQDDAVAIAAFKPRIKALQEHADSLSATLQLNLHSGEIEEIEIVSREPLSPAFSVTLDAYRLTLTFKPEQGANLLHKLESHAVGKAGFIKSFDALVVADFRDYKRVQP